MTARTVTTLDPASLPKHFEAAEAERRWDEAWQKSGVYHWDPASPGAELRGGHAAAHRLGLAPHRPRLQLQPDRHGGALPAHARPQRLLPDGLGRQRRAHRAPRAEPLPRALRPHPAPRPRPAPRAARGEGAGAQDAAARDLAPRLHRPLRARHRRGREVLPRDLAAHGPLGGLAHRVRDDRPPLAPARAALVLGPVPEGPRLRERRALHVGRGLPDGGGAGRGRGPRDGRAPTTTSRSASRAASGAS